MHVSDIVECKELMKSTGVMGSSLISFKKFDGYALVLKVDKNVAKIMTSSGSKTSIKKIHVKVIITEFDNED